MTNRISNSARQDPSQPDLEEQAITWFVRLRADNITDTERHRFEKWLADDPRHRATYQSVARLWEEQELALAVKKTAERMEMQALLKPAAVRRRSRTAFAVAAAVCLAVSLNFTLPSIVIYLQQDFSTASGQQQRIELADGSLLTLNTDSAVAVDYSAGQRRIRLLKGEAVFDVQPDKQRPFVVEAENITAQAVGTRYRVYRYEEGVNVDVLEGIVEVKANHGDALQIRRNQLVRLGDSGSLAPVASNPADSAWMQGRLVFDNTRLEDALHEIGRYHAGILVLANPRIRNMRISGSFSLADPTAILETLEQTLPISLLRFTDRAVLVY